jgi:hypothetical protein
MAIHTTLPIYGVAYDLLKAVSGTVDNMPRNAKPVLGMLLVRNCLRITDLIRDANVATEKDRHLEKLLQRLARVETLLRVGVELSHVKRPAYGDAIRLTQSIGRQASGWRKSSSTSPVARPSRQSGPSDSQSGRAARPQGDRHAR